MRGSDAATLQQLVEAINSSKAQWQAAMPGVQLTQANVTMPDGLPLSLILDAPSGEWIVQTSST